jgi:hypothetical protein
MPKLANFSEFVNGIEWIELGDARIYDHENLI